MSFIHRYLFSHGIASRKTDIIPGESGKNLILKQRTERISFTFRKIRSGSCNCLYPLKCDSQNYGKISIVKYIIITKITVIVNLF